ncbi:MAG: ATP-binding cassette domain-containing protein [Betaproteobacteria bacterium]|nr:ATP-binding cassette domain-containing protein [Betaproteobacteria bacterium]
MSVLELRGVSKRFGGIVVADDIMLDLQAGQILGLIGPNGAGKTSLFNLISGIFPTDTGEILVAGVRIGAMRVHQRARMGIARTWQNMRLFQTMTVLENMVVAPRDYAGESLLRLCLRPGTVRQADAEACDRALGILERMQLAHLADSSVTDLPFGQQKLVGLARALMNDGPCLLLDEPMAGVEGQSYETMRAVVREEAARGRAVCVVEHNISFIRDLCTSAVFMANGRILERGGIADLLASKTLAELYFGA